ncbi:MAG: cytochrome c biogenesis protein [Candidatus Bathyarchaeota archaeon]|jgi:heme exporter protein C|nr:cytochrome c biogenesis protein [Candidatus Bathyarchaeota archaeon]
MKDKPILAGLFLANLISLYMIFIWAPPERSLGDSYRVFFIHTPAAWVSYLAFAITFLGSILYLKTEKPMWDLYASSASLLGLLFCLVTLITGSMWAKLAWGIYWNWDPRETSTLILLLVYLAYISFRMSISDKDRKARTSAVLGILAFVSIPLSYFSAVFWATLHPMPLFPINRPQLGIEPSMLLTLAVSMIGVTLLFSWMFYLTLNMYRMTEKAELSLLEIKE